MLVKNYTEYDFLEQYDVLKNGARILNVGSSTVRYGDNCINIDIQDKPNVDVVCDAHDLPESLGEFDAIVCNAVLQYCRSPEVVCRQLHGVLKEGGLLFVDAPWVQPFCPDTPDRFRFSEDALKSIFADFEILESGPSIRPGSAFLMLGVRIARTMTTNKYINVILGKVAKLILYPLRWIRTKEEQKTAGAFYLVCKKTARQSE